MHESGRPRNRTDATARTFSRRTFLQASALGGVAATCGGVALPAARADEDRESGRWPVPAFEFEEATVTELQQAMMAGRTTSGILCAAYLERIAALDRQGPTLRSIIETNPDALSIADALDTERKQGRVRGPLHGIPVLIKDNIATADRMQTSAGSLALVGVAVQQDAFIAARLRDAGAVILGKTNLSEWANFRSTQSSSGWSARGGQCRNPYALDRSPCGSSSGTGAAIAANLAAVGVGTETDGSVVCPSSMCSLVGVKPTLGLVSRSGIVPIAHSQDTAGPMARCVADAAVLLGALTGVDPDDATTSAAAGQAAADYSRNLDPEALRGARIGVVREKLFGYSPEADALVEAALQVLAENGAELVDPVTIPHLGEYDEAEFEVLLYEFKADLTAYLAGLGRGTSVEDTPRSLEDLIAFNERNREREMPFFGQEIFEMALEKGPLTDAKYVESLETCHRLSRTEGLDQAFAQNRLDALVAPTGSPPWPIDLINGDHFLGGSSSAAAVSGYPSITVPVGYSFGLPVGMSLIGLAWSEQRLLNLAYAYEQSAKPRRPPQLLPRADLPH
jgi:amidase